MKVIAAYLVLGFCLFVPHAHADQCSVIPGNLVTNCGFETGTFSGWNLSGYGASPVYLGVSHGVDTLDAHTGSFGAYFGGFGGVLNLLQYINTVPGTEYQVTYWLAQSPATESPYLSSFSTTFGGMTLFSAGNAPDLPYRQYNFVTLATATQSLLNFGARDDTGFFSIDDVAVIPITTPEPASFSLLFTASGLLLIAKRISRSGRL